MNKIKALELQEENIRIAAHYLVAYGPVSLEKQRNILLYDPPNKDDVTDNPEASI